MTDYVLQPDVRDRIARLEAAVRDLSTASRGSVTNTGYVLPDGSQAANIDSGWIDLPTFLGPPTIICGTGAVRISQGANMNLTTTDRQASLLVQPYLEVAPTEPTAGTQFGFIYVWLTLPGGITDTGMTLPLFIDNQLGGIPVGVPLLLKSRYRVITKSAAATWHIDTFQAHCAPA